MDDLYVKYICDSALYCQHLFSAAEKFFKANVLVEEVISESRTLDNPRIEEISSTFREASAWAGKARKSLRDFEISHNSFPDQEIIIDSTEQMSRIDRVSALGASLATLTSTLIPGEDLQEQIWDNPEYTRQFTEMAELICKAVLWQQSLAVETHNEI